MVVGYTTTCAITTNVVCSYPAHCEVYSIQHYVIKYVSDLQQTSDFLRVFCCPPPIKLITNDITDILLKVLLNTISPSLQCFFLFYSYMRKNSSATGDNFRQRSSTSSSTMRRPREAGEGEAEVNAVRQRACSESKKHGG